MSDHIEKVSGRRTRGRRSPRGRTTEREIRALISLLADDDNHIVDMVQENLIRLRAAALPFLEEAGENPDPRMRIRARFMAARIHRDLLEEQFRQLGARDEADFELEDGLIAIARIEYPNLEAGEVAAQLEALADALRPRMSAAATPREKVDLLISFLFRELGFRGDRKHYSDPRNSFINKVLDRRLGIPITLCAVMILVGRRLGLPLYGVGLPKHFLVKYRDATTSTEIFIDAYNGGRVLTRQECTEMLTNEGYYVRESFVADYLAVSSPRDIVIRMLRNLMLIYSKHDRQLLKRLTRYVDILGMHGPAR